MSQKAKKATRSHRPPAMSARRLSISYREAAKLLQRSKSHIHAVCSGTRESADLERKLTPYFINPDN
jgi:hypothetical protein